MPDGESLSRDQMVAALSAIVAATNVPVSADIERGYGEGRPEDVAETVSAVLQAGVVGINIEDAPGQKGEALHTMEYQAARIQAARKVADEAGIALFINARTDVFLAGPGKPDVQLAEVIRRANIYLASGADGIFVPGLSDLPAIRLLVKEIDAPVNIMVGSGSPAISALTQAGVARISLGPAITLTSFSMIKNAAEALLQRGAYDQLHHDFSFADVNSLMSR